MKYLNILVLLFFISACSEDQADIKNPLKYNKSDISFSYPSNWEVTEDTEIEGVRFIFIESSGDAITKIEVYSIDESYELKEYVELDIDAFVEEMPSMITVDGDNEIEEINTSIKGVEFNGYKYEFDISVVGIDVPHVSEFYSFYSPQKAAYFSSQVAVEDLEKVKDGFEQLLSTFSLK